MSEIKVKLKHETEDSNLKFAVIVARYEQKWIFVKHKKRDTFELPGGKREDGESIEETAMRELFEETGATEYELTHITDYCVEKDGLDSSWGRLYFAEVSELDILPEISEMSELDLFEFLPDDMTYPEIQPKLFHTVQFWINSIGVEDELWDLYDRDRNLLNKTHKRGDPNQIPEGAYHMVVFIVIRNSDGKFLITKRSPNKAFPNIWEFTGGSALAGDSSLTAALREVKEETGFSLNPENGKCVLTAWRDNSFGDIWFFNQDFDLKDAILQESETTDIRLATFDEIQKLRQDKKFSTFDFWDELVKLINI